MHRSCRIALGILVFVLCGWVSRTPLFAHHLVNGVAESIEIHADAEQEIDAEELVITLPPNFFVRTISSELSFPTDMVILPSGDLLVTEKGTGSANYSKAQVRLVHGDVLQPTPVLTLSVNSRLDSGLLGITIDPQFTTNNYFYLWYSTGAFSANWAGFSSNRLSRFVYNPATGKADPTSEVIILDNIVWSSMHNGGGLAFDNSGNLLITTGDAADEIVPAQDNRAQLVTSLSGKVLRIRPRVEGGYDIPSDNPFVGNDKGILPEIYASGLRNPFRIDKRSTDQKLYLVDVGQDFWEEVNLVTPKANYGWPYREGNCAIFEQDDACTPDTQGFAQPLLVYPHPVDMGGAVTALSFYEGALWPTEYQGKLFFADFNSQWIGFFDVDAADKGYKKFATDAGGLVDMEATPVGLYALSIIDGSIKFIYFDAEGNHPPTASMKVDITGGKTPLSVQFTATAKDADEDAMVFHWDFGDGSKLTTTLPTATHVYTQDGDFSATLQVIDEDDGKSDILTQFIQVYSGEIAQIVQSNLTTPWRVLYNGGDRMSFRAARTAGMTGLDPTAPYAWTIYLHHNEHVHIQVTEQISSEVLLELPIEAHALGEPLWYEVELSMRTASGQVIKNTLEVRPQTTTIQVQSWPGESQIKISGRTTSPEEITTLVVGEEYSLEASASLVSGEKIGKFKNWVVTESWPVANIAGETETVSERIFSFRASSVPKTYIAFYEYTGEATITFLPRVGN